MKTAQKNTRLNDNLVTAFARYASCGFESFRHRIADQLSLQGYELAGQYNLEVYGPPTEKPEDYVSYIWIPLKKKNE